MRIHYGKYHHGILYWRDYLPHIQRFGNGVTWFTWHRFYISWGDV